MARKVEFRDCKKSDLSRLQSLVDELYITDAGPDVHIPDVKITYAALREKPEKGRLLVFDRGGTIVGYTILIFFWSNEFAGDIIDIDEILVTEAARGTGVAHAFFRWLKGEYKESAAGWSLQVRPVNKRAASLYQSVGFCPSGNTHMYNLFCWKSESPRKLQRRTAAKSTPKTAISQSKALARRRLPGEKRVASSLARRKLERSSSGLGVKRRAK